MATHDIPSNRQHYLLCNLPVFIIFSPNIIFDFGFMLLFRSIANSVELFRVVCVEYKV